VSQNHGVQCGKTESCFGGTLGTCLGVARIPQTPKHAEIQKNRIKELPVIDPAVVKRYETFAEASPEYYRLYVALAAIAGDAAKMAFRLIPLAIGIGVPLLFYQQPFFYWVGGISFVILAWLMRPSLRIAGRHLEAHEGAALREDIRALQQTLSMPGSISVLINEEFNAAAYESRGFFGLFGTKRTLVLGMPLLISLSARELRAVVAHELGHFSRRHGRLGHWLYRARAGWLAALEAGDSGWILSRAMASYASWFVPWFAAMSFVYSRQCEYEADADAVSATGQDDLAAALTRVHVLSAFWGSGAASIAREWSRTDAAPPPDYFVRMSAAIEPWLAEHGAEGIQLALKTAPKDADTHPALALRLKAIGTGAPKTLSAPGHASAGAEWFADQWPRLMAEFSESWQRENAQRWAAQFHLYNAIEKPLLDTPLSDLRAYPIEQRVRHALALDTDAALQVDAYVDAEAPTPQGETRTPSKSLIALSALHAEQPNHPLVAFQYWAHRLLAGDAAAVDALEALWSRAPVWRLPVAKLLCAHFSAQEQADADRGSEWQAKLDAHWRSRETAIENALLMLEGNADATQTAQDWGDPLQRYAMLQFASDRAVACAWMLSVPLQLLKSQGPENNIVNIHALYLQLDTEQLELAKRDEDEVASEYVDVVQAALLPCDVVVVRTFLTTETLPSYLTEREASYRR
jgi:Zn-dependent protease with chaperone function